MNELFQQLVPINQHEAEVLRHESERMFALGFLAWFGNRPQLYHEPCKVSAPDLGYTFPDFATPYGEDGIIMYEVTLTTDTQNRPRKRRQRHIYAESGNIALEVNGNALRCCDTTMSLLEKLYAGTVNVEEVQLFINCLGRDANVFHSVLANELAQI